MDAVRGVVRLRRRPPEHVDVWRYAPLAIAVGALLGQLIRLVLTLVTSGAVR